MIEDEFFQSFINNLNKEIDNDNFLLQLKKLIDNKKLTQTQYRKLIRMCANE